MGLFQGINVVSISVPDMRAAREFYANTLGLGEPLYDLPDADWIEFATGAAGNISLVLAPEGWVPSEATTIVLNTEDCYASCEELRRRGVHCDDPVGVPGMVTYCSFYDPYGNRLQMCSAPPEG